MPTSMAEPTTPARMPIRCIIRSTASSLARYCMNPVAAVISPQFQSRIPTLASPPWLQPLCNDDCGRAPAIYEYKYSGYYTPLQVDACCPIYHSNLRHLDSVAAPQPARSALLESCQPSLGTGCRQY